MQMQKDKHSVEKYSNMYMCLIIFYTSQVKNKPYHPGEEYAFVLENGAVMK
jgi:hypothetical protein